jgi:hypothetical protein
MKKPLRYGLQGSEINLMAESGKFVQWADVKHLYSESVTEPCPELWSSFLTKIRYMSQNSRFSYSAFKDSLKASDADIRQVFTKAINESYILETDPSLYRRCSNREHNQWLSTKQDTAFSADGLLSAVKQSSVLAALKIAQRYMPTVSEVQGSLADDCFEYDNPENLIVEIELVNSQIQTLEA